MEQVEKWNEGFMEPLMDVKKENAKERGRRRKLLFYIRDVLRTQLKAVNYFRKKRYIVDIWQIYENASNSEYSRVTQNPEWSGQS